MSEFRKVATLDQIPEGRGLAVEVGGRRIALFRVEGTVHAIEARCARHDAPLEKGAVDDEVLYCPWHSAEFDLERGVCSAFPDEGAAAVIPARVDGRDVWVDA